MNLADGKISKRQWFRMSYLECVTISMMMIPYITLSLAGKYHVPALVVGLAFVVLYGACDTHRGLFLHDLATVSAAKLLRVVDLPAVSRNHIVWCVQVDGRTRTDV